MLADKKKTIRAELTPDAYLCVAGPGCPSVFETSEGTLLVIGKVVSPDLRDILPSGRVAEDETVIEIPRGLVADIKFQQA